MSGWKYGHSDARWSHFSGEGHTFQIKLPKLNLRTKEILWRFHIAQEVQCSYRTNRDFGPRFEGGNQRFLSLRFALKHPFSLNKQKTAYYSLKRQDSDQTRRHLSHCFRKSNFATQKQNRTFHSTSIVFQTIHWLEFTSFPTNVSSSGRI